MNVTQHPFSFDDIMDMFGGNVDNVKTTVSIFCSQMALDVNNLKENYGKKDYAAVKSFAHRMKPNFKMFQMTDLHQLIQDIEKSSVAGEGHLLGEQLEVFYDKITARCKLMRQDAEKL